MPLCKGEQRLPTMPILNNTIAARFLLMLGSILTPKKTKRSMRVSNS